MSHENYEEQSGETHGGVHRQTLVFITLSCVLFMRAVGRGSLGFSIMCDSAFFEPLAAANLDHTENCSTNHHVSPCLALKGRESRPSSSNGSY